MILKRAVLLSGALIFLILLFYGCASIDRGSIGFDKAEGREKRASIKLRDEREFSEIRSVYDLESILLPVLQYNNLALSFDYFPQFTWDSDVIFPQYLGKFFMVEDSPFRPGEGTVLTAGYEGLGTELRIERALLSREPDGDWWKIEQTYFDDTIYYEVLISDSGDPVRIRYIDPETGKPHEVASPIALEHEVMDEGSMGDGTPENGEPGLEELRAQELSREWSYAFNEPAILGEEIIEVAAGRFMTVHVRDAYDDEYATGADYWISPDVPGSIIRIVYSSPGQESYVIELQELTVGNASMINTSEIVEGLYDGGDSEGRPSEPLHITVGEPHFGWVGPGGTSYYRVTAEKRADIYITVEDLDGTAELYYYGGDLTFFDWRTSSSGSELSAEEYFVEPGIDLFFTVVNPGDGDGSSYRITVTEDVFLSPIGVGMRGEIYYRARELKPGRTYTEILNIDGLSYYMTRVMRGRHFRITASDLPPSVEVVWFEASGGSFSGVYAYRENSTNIIEITDVAPGTECYFYVVGDTEETPLGSSFSLSIEEYTR